MPLETEKNGLYTIKMYKRHSDDPINNIIDAMRNISVYDTATVIMPIKPMPEQWSEDAQKKVDRLYKNLDIK